jgi:UPF0755 protein
MFGRRSTPPEPLDPEVAAAEKPAKAAAPPPPPPRRRIRRPRGGLLSMMSGLLSFAVVLGGAVVFGLIALAHEVEKPGPLDADKVVMIPKGTGTAEIASLLSKEQVIDNPTLFELYSHLSRRKGELKAGEYLFKARTSIEDAIDTLIGGKAILYSITIPEGLTSEQIVARLRENDILTGDVRETPREGSLMPNTYKVERGWTRQKLVNDMQAASRQALDQIWSRRSPDLPIRTAQELVILASIVEKETGVASERPRVASVFINRLQRRMKLQSDPTIVYGLVGGKGTLGRGITRAEIDRPTPYNTYTIEGLPPGPIANPGRAALEAVANPVKTRDLYFVADGSGGHAFAESYADHQRNVARWRQIERSRGDPSGAEVDRATPNETRSDFEAGGAASRTASTNRAFDASEGTSRDPLANKTWDLSSPKTVPSFGPEMSADPPPARAAARQRGKVQQGQSADALPPGVRMPPR